MPRPQFSLRSLFVLTTLVALGCGVPLIYKRIEARRAAQVVLVYLEASRDGEEDRARATLTCEARETAAKYAKEAKDAQGDTPFFNTEVSFAVVHVELIVDASVIGWDRAVVICKYTDLDDDGVPQIVGIMFALRRESGDWRIDGVGAH